MTINKEGLRRARMVGQWFLGDPSWGETFVRSYLNEAEPYVLEAEAEIGEDYPPEPATPTDEAALDRINLILSDPEWGVGMLEDIHDIVRSTGREEVEGAEWSRH